ncbi:unnamed protein product, partial [Larinioides sclopetarius]
MPKDQSRHFFNLRFYDELISCNAYRNKKKAKSGKRTNP